jgi:hypothetical protein
LGRGRRTGAIEWKERGKASGRQREVKGRRPRWPSQRPPACATGRAPNGRRWRRGRRGGSDDARAQARGEREERLTGGAGRKENPKMKGPNSKI